jgi:hypothetical protein
MTPNLHVVSRFAGRGLTRARIPLSTAAIVASVVFVAGYEPSSVRAATGASSAGTTVPTVVFKAAAAQGSDGMEIRLRWSLQDGWLPDGGFNIYRSDRTAPLNLRPLGVSPSSNAPAEIPVGTSHTHTFKLGTLLQRAAQAPAGSAVPPLITNTVRPASSASRFAQLATSAQQHHTLLASSLPVQGSANSNAGSGTLSAAQGLPASGAKALPHTAGAMQTPPLDSSIAARRTLLLGAAVSSDVASALGMAYDDANVTAGQTYKYTLRAVISGKEYDAASITMAVPTSATGLKPPAPTNLQAAQLGVQSVGLRWQRLSVADEMSLGVAKYDIYRSEGVPGSKPSSSLGMKLNDLPVLVTDTGESTTAGGAGSGEPATFFNDNTPPELGGAGNAVMGTATSVALTYQVTVTDIFGRTSDPGQVTLTFQDWHKPLAVPVVAAQLQIAPQFQQEMKAYRAARLRLYRRPVPFFKTPLTQAPPRQEILVAWTPSYQDPADNSILSSGIKPPQAGLAYKIYRLDTESQAQSPTLLATVTPDSNSLIWAAQLQAGGARDSLANQACLAYKNLAWTPNCDNLSDADKTSYLTQAQLSPGVKVYTYADTSAQKDHYYRYFVGAVFTRNSEESALTRGSVIAYPNFTPPVAVTDATYTFQLGAVPGSGSAQAAAAQAAANSQTARQSNAQRVGSATSGSVATAVGLAARQGSSGASSTGAAASGSAAGGSAKPLTLTNWTGPLVKASPRDMGGTLILKWTASHDAAKYEVYRANAIHNMAPSRAGCNGSPLTCKSALAVAWYNSPDPDAGATGAAASQAQRYGNGTPLADSNFVFLGTTKTPEYHDELSRSSAHYYVYRIIPVNRWNVPGPLLSIAARAPATLPPTAPKLLVGVPDEKGGVEVEFAPVGDVAEEIDHYELWRVTLWDKSAAFTSTGANSQAPVSTATPNNSGGQIAAQSATAKGGTALASGSSGAGSTWGAGRAGGVFTTGGSTAGGSTAGVSSVAASGSYATRSAAQSASSLKVSQSVSGLRPAMLAGAAARYGIVIRQPLLSAAVRNGSAVSSVASLESLAQQSARTATSVNKVSAGQTTATGTWMTDDGSTTTWQNDYAYWVRAIDSDGLATDSDLVDVTPRKISASSPGNLRATWNNTECAVDVAWQSTDAETQGFVIERTTAASASTTAGSSGSSSGTAVATRIQNVPAGLTSVTASGLLLSGGYTQLSGITQPTVTQYTDHSVFPDNSYLYRVRTVDAAGNLSEPTILANAVPVPDSCGASVPRAKVTPRNPAAPATSSSSTAPSLQASPGSPGAVTAPEAPSVPTTTSPKPADEITIPDSSSGVVSPQAPAVPKPADELDIPATRPKN